MRNHTAANGASHVLCETQTSSNVDRFEDFQQCEQLWRVVLWTTADAGVHQGLDSAEGGADAPWDGSEGSAEHQSQEVREKVLVRGEGRWWQGKCKRGKGGRKTGQVELRVSLIGK